MNYQVVYEKWLASDALSEAEKEELRSIETNEDEKKIRFCGSLSFGTAGLRGVMKVGLNANSSVEHRVLRDRFTLEHVDKTVYSGIMTQYRLRRDLYAPQDWTDANVRERATKAEKLARNEVEGSANYVLQKSTARAFRDVLEHRRADQAFLDKKNKN